LKTVANAVASKMFRKVCYSALARVQKKFMCWDFYICSAAPTVFTRFKHHFLDKLLFNRTKTSE